ncbi:MAG TPA: chemotaxis-specific protein-glutamate methyltransferase CheB [Limnochordales bacterium]
MSVPIRVLVVDDSALMRQMISRFLSEAGMEVCGTARDGVEGLAKALALRPDVITLDVQMPRMDGLAMLARLMEEAPTPVVMVSSVTQRQAPAAVEALMLGAVDVVAKPGGPISVNLGDVREELVAKVRAAARAQVRPRRARGQPDGRPGTARLAARLPAAEAPAEPRPGPVSAAPPAREPLAPSRGPQPAAFRTAAPRTGTPRPAPARPASAPADTTSPVPASQAAERPGEPEAPAAPGPPAAAKAVAVPGPVVVGSSTGGPSALSTLLSGLPADFPRPVIIVQHMPEGFTASLARRLDGLSPLHVAEAEPGRLPRPGEAWVARGGFHLLFDEEGHMVLSSAPPHLGVRPAVDLTLESAVDVWGGQVVAVILTGMGMDGARGARKLKRAGGRVLAQDEATSVVYGMPRVVKELALADEVHSLQDMAAALVRVVAQADGRSVQPNG